MNSSANTVVFDSSCTQSMAIVGVSAMKTRLRLFATLNWKIENQNNNRRNRVFCCFHLSSVSSTMNFTLSLESSVIVTCGWLANGILNVFQTEFVFFQRNSSSFEKATGVRVATSIDIRQSCQLLKLHTPRALQICNFSVRKNHLFHDRMLCKT
jgi:hypothetical protein